MPRYVGVDGCGGGWLTVASDGSNVVDEGVYDSFEAVVDDFASADRLLVDMPIGLPTRGRRACDEAARDRLGSRAPTVFYAPCRAALDADDHATASEVNREHTGYGLSIQAWHLVPHIREVDEALRAVPDRQEWVAEAHPELCFAALGEGVVAASKRTADGRAERLSRLRAHLPAVDDAYERLLETYTRATVSRDDALDALVLAVAAANPLRRVPDVSDGAVPRDATALPMEIRFPVSVRSDENTS